MTTLEDPASRRRRRVIAAIILLVPLIFSIGATQFIAARFAYHPALGSPLVGHIYAPWAWLIWNARFRQTAPQIFSAVHAAAGALGIAASLAALFALELHGRAAQRHKDVHDTALHTASQAEMRDELRAEIACVHKELKADIAGLRRDLPGMIVDAMREALNDRS
jgi:type IV secretory pathway TraG/TraD family ATPase VirD4